MSLGKGRGIQRVVRTPGDERWRVVKRTFEQALSNGRLGKAIARVVGRPGSLRFRLARGTAGG